MLFRSIEEREVIGEENRGSPKGKIEMCGQVSGKGSGEVSYDGRAKVSDERRGGASWEGTEVGGERRGVEEKKWAEKGGEWKLGMEEKWAEKGGEGKVGGMERVRKDKAGGWREEEEGEKCETDCENLRRSKGRKKTCRKLG